MKALAVIYFLFCTVWVFVWPLLVVALPSTSIGLAESIARSCFVGGVVAMGFCALASNRRTLVWYFVIGMLMQPLCWWLAPRDVHSTTNLLLALAGMGVQFFVLLAVKRRWPKNPTKL